MSLINLSNDDFDRLCASIRATEANTKSEGRHTPQPTAPAGLVKTIVRVIDGTPDADGYYNAVFITKGFHPGNDTGDPDLECDFEVTKDADNDDDALKVKGYNGSKLGVDQNYECSILGFKDKLPRGFIDDGSRSKARFVMFTLPSALVVTDASKASCTVGGYWDGPSPGSTITVYNIPASTNYIFFGASGNTGLASYDPTNDKYWIIQVECP